MKKQGVSFLLFSLIAFQGPAHAETRGAGSDPAYWPTYYKDPYSSSDPAIARPLRCAALVEAIAVSYFSPLGFGDKDRPRLNEMSKDTPRMPPSDVTERLNYAQTYFDIYNDAEKLGRAKPKHTASDFYSWYQFLLKQEASAKVQKGTAYQALQHPSLRCFEYPQIGALQSTIRGRLARPLPWAEKMTSPKVRPEWMPYRIYGYLYGAKTYRHLTCAGIAQAVAEARFGYMPPPDQPDPSGWATGKMGARLDPTALGERTIYRNAVRDTFLAGQKYLVANNATERLSYVTSFHYAATHVDKLVQNDVVDEAMAEPTLRCGEIPSMAPIVGRAKSNTSPSADVTAPPGIVAWPDRKDGYFANPQAFRGLFCAALVDAAYNRGDSDYDSPWFAPPPEKGSVPAPADSPEAARARQAVRALYDKGKIDEEARSMGNMWISEYARIYMRGRWEARRIIAEKQGLVAMGHASTQCLALPELAPLADAIKRRIQQ